MPGGEGRRRPGRSGLAVSTRVQHLLANALGLLPGFYQTVARETLECRDAEPRAATTAGGRGGDSPNFFLH